MTATHPLADDLDAVVDRVGDAWRQLRGERLFITGGTGFVGTWLLETLAWANRRLNLQVRAVVLTRDVQKFAAKAPHLVEESLFEWHLGDVRTFVPPREGCFGIVHAAFDSGAAPGTLSPQAVAETIVDGTRRVLDSAEQWRSQRMLFVSSGAVYGPQPPDLERLSESYAGGPMIDSSTGDPPSPLALYRVAKRQAERLVLDRTGEAALNTSIARCFAFVGPYLPTDRHFAVGNFLSDRLAGRAIEVGGDGTPWRSYLYAADLAEWLWTIFLTARPATVVNVGSPEAIQIGALARRVAALETPPLPVRIAREPDPTKPAERYVPDCSRAAELFGLSVRTPLDEALRRTVAWHRRGSR
jgi:nucleoside-diphosphate-sugar epimerase